MTDLNRLFAALEVTWPAAATSTSGPFTIHDGAGGGKRVSAATANGPASEADIDAAEAAMRALGQVPLFQIRPGDESLDSTLADRGYAIVDPTRIYAAPVQKIAALEKNDKDVKTIHGWGPLAYMLELWREGGIGPERVAVMHRASEPKTALLGRIGNAPGGAAFVSVDGDVAMLHALEVHRSARRSGMGRGATIDAAMWAQDEGASTLALACTEANTGANALYSGLGMDHVGGYHYRQLT
ncbi:GNAT family N-acetyltransferase [Pseudooceanicola sp.]|uniref:GNAT family N-acetyltransferase n=1 Tax=Pseudooceanicola sp. TaxID=1914328 RepID=UPI00260AA4E0|nr:GNAT family N-acetyltransferase [Pseudooceanicola sp.]MDF1856257.1 GNAT family N-acetyltransferase [Pseudooceanicola sp.]